MRFQFIATFAVVMFACLALAAPVQPVGNQLEKRDLYSEISSLMKKGTAESNTLGGLIAQGEKGLAGLAYGGLIESGLLKPASLLASRLSGYQQQANSILQNYNGGECTPGRDIKDIFGEFATAIEDAFGPLVDVGEKIPVVGNYINAGYAAIRGFTDGLSANFCDF